MKPLADLIENASERTRLEEDGLRYRTLVNMIDHGDAVVMILGRTQSGPYLDDMLDRFKEPK